jgi:hypothetical protein
MAETGTIVGAWSRLGRSYAAVRVGEADGSFTEYNVWVDPNDENGQAKAGPVVESELAAVVTAVRGVQKAVVPEIASLKGKTVNL